MELACSGSVPLPESSAVGLYSFFTLHRTGNLFHHGMRKEFAPVGRVHVEEVSIAACFPRNFTEGVLRIV